MSQEESIKDTLNIIRKALEDDENLKETSDNNVLILNKLVQNDGTVEIIENQFIEKKEIKEILENNVSEHLEKNFEKWLDKNIPDYLDKYFKKKS